MVVGERCYGVKMECFEAIRGGKKGENVGIFAMKCGVIVMVSSEIFLT